MVTYDHTDAARSPMLSPDRLGRFNYGGPCHLGHNHYTSVDREACKRDYLESGQRYCPIEGR